MSESDSDTNPETKEVVASKDGTVDDGLPQMPRKRFYRQRAHVNPHSFHNLEYPPTPEEFVVFLN